MIDFHTHILPAMDDGCQSVEETQAVLESMQAQGIKKVIATPHFDMRQETVEDFLERRKDALEKVILPEGMEIVPGAEVLYCGMPLHRYEDVEKLAIAGTRYILVETMFFSWDERFVQDIKGLAMERGLVPILAHAERYAFSKKNLAYIREMRKEGVILQVNANSFLKRKAVRCARKLLKKEGVKLIGSDCHDLNHRPPNLKVALDYIQKKMGKEYTTALMHNAEKMFS